MDINGTVIDKVVVCGTVVSKSTISGTIALKESISGSVGIGSVFEKEKEYYDGSYEIKPTTETQVMQTKEKVMSDDLTITAIPYAEVTNLANGITVTIGGNE